MHDLQKVNANVQSMCNYFKLKAMRTARKCLIRLLLWLILYNALHLFWPTKTCLLISYNNTNLITISKKVRLRCYWRYINQPNWTNVHSYFVHLRSNSTKTWNQVRIRWIDKQLYQFLIWILFLVTLLFVVLSALLFNIIFGANLAIHCPRSDEPGKPVFHLDNPGSSKYFICINGSPVEQSCPSNLRFHPELKRCDF